MWARAKVDELMWQDLAGLQSGHFPAPLHEAIVQVALAHRLMTQFTSFVAVEERVVNEGGVQRKVAVPVEMPQGVRYEGVFGGTEAEDRVAGNAVRKFAREAAAPALARSDAPVEEKLTDGLAKLAPEPSAGQAKDGQVVVKVHVRRTRAAVLRRLRAAGLHVHQVAARWVIGSIAVEKLDTLAALPDVARVEPMSTAADLGAAPPPRAR
jgi:hypothetical protein